MKKYVFAALLVAAPFHANAQNVSVLLSVQQAQYVAHALDMTVRAEGLQAAEMALPILNQLRTAAAPGPRIETGPVAPPKAEEKVEPKVPTPPVKPNADDKGH